MSLRLMVYILYVHCLLLCLFGASFPIPICLTTSPLYTDNCIVVYIGRKKAASNRSTPDHTFVLYLSGKIVLIGLLFNLCNQIHWSQCKSSKSSQREKERHDEEIHGDESVICLSYFQSNACKMRNVYWINQWRRLLVAIYMWILTNDCKEVWYSAPSDAIKMWTAQTHTLLASDINVCEFVFDDLYHEP